MGVHRSAREACPEEQEEVRCCQAGTKGEQSHTCPYGEAEEAKEQAQRDKTVYEDKLATADSEAREVVRSAMTKANEMSDEILADTGREVARMKARAEADIAQERKRAANALKDDVADLSMEIAEKVIGREIGEDDHRALIDDCIKELQ